MQQVIDIISELETHPTKSYRSRLPREIKQIVIHHSATDPISDDGKRDVEAFARYHVRNNKWPGIGYHYVIGRNGTVLKTQPNTVVSYHAGNANKNSIGVCLVGNFDVAPPPKAQWDSAVSACRGLMEIYGISKDHVIGHREVPGTKKTCPGKAFDIAQFREELG